MNIDLHNRIGSLKNDHPVQKKITDYFKFQHLWSKAILQGKQHGFCSDIESFCKDEILMQWQPTLVFLRGKSHGWRSPVGYSPWDRKVSETTERHHWFTGSGNDFNYTKMT